MKIKQSLGVASGLLALTMLGGCLTSDDPKSGATGLTLATEAEITSIVTPIADSGTPGILATTTTNYTCDGDEVEEGESPQTYNYAFNGGFLYLWKTGKCTAMKLEGTSTKIQGTWTSTDLSARIPAKYRSAECENVDLEDHEYESYLKDAVVTYTITSSKIKGSVKGALCYGAVFKKQFEDAEDITVVSYDCATIKLRNDDVERTATITVSLKDEKLTETVAYNGMTCKTSYPATLDQTKEPTCSEEEEEEQEELEEAFNECMGESEFREDFNTGSSKTSSEFRSPLEKALGISLPF